MKKRNPRKYIKWKNNKEKEETFKVREEQEETDRERELRSGHGTGTETGRQGKPWRIAGKSVGIPPREKKPPFQCSTVNVPHPKPFSLVSHGIPPVGRIERDSRQA